MNDLETDEYLGSVADFWAQDAGQQGAFLARCFVPASICARSIGGPAIVSVRHDGIFDLTSVHPTMTDALDDPDIAKVARDEGLPHLCGLESALAASGFNKRDPSTVHFLAPVDWQVIKGCGVTFMQSLMERLIEEQAKGDSSRASEIREQISSTIGSDLARVKPGTQEAANLKERLIEMDLWSQYLEVAIGPHAEVFTKAPVLSSVGVGERVGIRRDSVWNNPEPEVVLLVNSKNRIVGSTLGNDVNLRDFEGRSALLLGEAKDFEGGCALGPAVRLFDPAEGFTLETLMDSSVKLSIEGLDGFELAGESDLKAISRDPYQLVDQTGREARTFPDGYALFIGTMFAPTKDRFGSGEGFTHVVGDRVEISNPHLGRLVNWVDYSDEVPKWSFGARAFSQNLASRGFI